MKNWITGLLKPNPHLSGFLVAVILLAFIVASNLGYHDIFKDLLDREDYALRLGAYSFTPYKILSTLFIIVMIVWTSSLISGSGERFIIKFPRMRNANKAILIKIFQIAVYFIAFMVALDMLGIDLTAFAVLGGAIGIGLGFGLQKIASNFISGLILVFEKSIRVGDLVQMSDGTTGYIRRAGARYTRLDVGDGREVIIPNEDFIIGRVTNLTFTDKKAQVKVTIPVSYASDLVRARELILESAKEHPRCVTEPRPSCFLREFGANGANFLLLFFVEDVTEGTYGPQSDIMFSILKKFKENDIDIPAPNSQYDINILNNPIEKIGD